MKESYDEFLETLLFNVKQRSRTAQGKSNTGASSVKLPLLLQGVDLEKKVTENLLQVAPWAWETTGIGLSPNDLRSLFNDWFDILQDGLIDYGGYRSLREDLKQQWALERGKEVQINPRFRLWEVHYDTLRVKPCDIDTYLVGYTTFMATWFNTDRFDDRREFASYLAFVDRQLDRVIHPWLDGCGRLATLLVMWVSRHSSFPYPRFKPHSEHYASMTTLGSHIKYFEEILG